MELLGDVHVAPIVHWPAARSRMVVAENASILPGATDRDIVDFIDEAGGVTAPELAAALAVHRQTAWQRLKRLQAQGLVMHEGNQWQAAREPQPA